MTQSITQKIKLVTSALALALTFATGFAPQVHADTNSDPMVVYCQRYVKGPAKAGCSITPNNSDEHGSLTRMRNTATYYCIDQPVNNGKKSECVDYHQHRILRQIGDRNPTSKLDFVIAAELIMKADNKANGKGATADSPSPDSKEATPSTTTGGTSQADCSETNGTCFSCNGGPGGQNCNVGCTNGLCTDPAANPNASCKNHSCDLIQKYLNPIINLFSLVFGFIAVISLILGGIQFSTSEGDPQKANNAKSRITKTIVAIVAYFFMFSLLQFLVPGGLFNRQ
jgi:hypothetical protein